MKKNYCFILAIFLMNGFTKAQSGFVSLGADVSNSSSSMSYSLGQVDYITIFEGALTQGNQQAYEFYNASVVNPYSSFLQITLYPNPVKDILFLDIKNTNNTNIQYKITDVQGKLIIENQYSLFHPNIDTELWQAGMYFITFYTGEIAVNTYKIIKQ